MKQLDAKLLNKFLKIAGSSLEGKWLLVGGTLLPALGIDARSTIDIDLIGLGRKEADQSLQLMEIAEQLGLGVETINQAAAFFLKKIKYDESDLLLLHQGKSANIYRPPIELYWKLKIGRLSETDLLDCQQYYTYCVTKKDPINVKKLAMLLKAASAFDPSPEKSLRLKTLERLLSVQEYQSLDNRR